MLASRRSLEQRMQEEEQCDATKLFRELFSSVYVWNFIRKGGVIALCHLHPKYSTAYLRWVQ